MADTFLAIYPLEYYQITQGKPIHYYLRGEQFQ